MTQAKGAGLMQKNMIAMAGLILATAVLADISRGETGFGPDQSIDPGVVLEQARANAASAASILAGQASVLADQADAGGYAAVDMAVNVTAVNGDSSGSGTGVNGKMSQSFGDDNGAKTVFDQGHVTIDNTGKHAVTSSVRVNWQKTGEHQGNPAYDWNEDLDITFTASVGAPYACRRIAAQASFTNLKYDVSPLFGEDSSGTSKDFTVTIAGGDAAANSPAGSGHIVKRSLMLGQIRKWGSTITMTADVDVTIDGYR